MPPTFSDKTRGASRILGTGRYVPERILTNEDFEKIVDTSDEWITARTGMKRRHIAATDEATSDLASHALLDAVDDAGIGLDDLDCVIIATATPDMIFPSAACMVQKNDPVKAEDLLRKALKNNRDVFGDDHPTVAAGQLNLARVLALGNEEANLVEAESLFADAVSLSRRLSDSSLHGACTSYADFLRYKRRRPGDAGSASGHSPHPGLAFD